MVFNTKTVYKVFLIIKLKIYHFLYKSGFHVILGRHPTEKILGALLSCVVTVSPVVHTIVTVSFWCRASVQCPRYESRNVRDNTSRVENLPKNPWNVRHHVKSRRIPFHRYDLYTRVHRHHLARDLRVVDWSGVRETEPARATLVYCESFSWIWSGKFTCVLDFFFSIQNENPV